MQSTISVIIKNETPHEVRFWIYFDNDDEPVTRKIAKAGGAVTVALKNEGHHLLGAWYAEGDDQKLFAENHSPIVARLEFKRAPPQTYKVVLGAGGIRFE